MRQLKTKGSGVPGEGQRMDEGCEGRRREQHPVGFETFTWRKAPELSIHQSHVWA